MGVASSGVIVGPLAAHAADFQAELERVGYSPGTVAQHLRLMAHLSRWLTSKKLDPGDLVPGRVERFLRDRRAKHETLFSPRAIAPLLVFLRGRGVVPPEPLPPAPTALDRLVGEYGDYLRHERAITESVIRAREGVAREILAELATGDSVDFRGLGGEHVTQFMLRKTRRYCVATAAGIGTAVRSLLRFLHVRGRITAPLVGAVPKMAGWRLTSLPRALEAGDVEKLLRSCDRRTSIGRRDYAVLLLLLRLGLRAGEVAALLLDDIQWRTGEILVRGKGRRRDRLPLPDDVGAAVAAYLRRDRPATDLRTVFVSSQAPHGALRTPAVTGFVVRASRRAGIDRVAAHRLRHTAATQILRRGGSLADIAEVLRHRSTLTTAIYAKVDRDALRSLARPWPAPLGRAADRDALRSLAQPWPGAS